MNPRKGLATVWAAIVLFTVSAVLTAVTAQMMYNRRVVAHREHQVQSLWLARAGIELAAARLIADPAGYEGETVVPIPNGDLRILVRKEKEKPNVYVVTSESRYPAKGASPVVQTITRRYQRTVEKEQVSLEILSP